jgi:hypothetical protein
MRYLNLLLLMALLSCYGRLHELSLLVGRVSGFETGGTTYRVDSMPSSHCHSIGSAVSREPGSQASYKQRVPGDDCCLKGLASAAFKLLMESPIYSLVLVLKAPKALGVGVWVPKIASSKVLRPPNPYLSNSVLLL